MAASNIYIKEQIYILEEDSDYSDDESVDVKKSNKVENKTPALDYKCVDCDFVGNTFMSLKKHTNTKHKLENHETKNKEPDHISDGIYDLFQMEILDSEEVYACNVCNKAFATTPALNCTSTK